MITIVVDQFFKTVIFTKHKFLDDIKKLYKYAGKFDGEQQYKYIIESVMVSNPEVLINNITMTVEAPGINKKLTSIKLLHKCSGLFYVKQKNAVIRLGDANKNTKAIRKVNLLWSNIENRKGSTKINSCFFLDLYYFILNCSHVVQSPIVNYCIKVYIDVHTEK